MPPSAPRDDFIWKEGPEPHVKWKQELLQKHREEINALMGHDPKTKYIVCALVGIQLGLAVCAPYWTAWGFALAVCTIGGTLNHILFLAVHEIVHNLAFKKKLPNDILALIANIPISIPYAMTFRQYHIEHHRFQGREGMDTDLPTELEARIFSGRSGKLAFVFFQILFYAFRPMFVRSQAMGTMHLVNNVVQGLAMFALYKCCGWLSLLYLLLSTFFAGFNPLAGHFISEHYVLGLRPDTTQETYSYYGPLNALAFNVGYHNEHHDFPNIPGSRLPELYKIARGHYDALEATPSWPGTLYRFVMDPRVTLWNRVKRRA